MDNGEKIQKTQIVTKTEALVLQEFSITEAAIDEMKKLFLALEIQGVEDKEGYERVYAARMEVKKRMAQIKERKKELKAEILQRGRQLDATEKKILELLQPIRDHLESQEIAYCEAKEKIRLEKAKKEEEKLQERMNRVLQYEAISNVPIATIKAMSEEDFDLYVEGKKLVFEEKEAERKAEQAAREEEMRKEKIRLYEERVKRDAEQAAREEEMRKEKIRLYEERVKRDEERKELDRIKAEQEIEAKKLAAEKAKLEAEKKALEVQPAKVEEKKEEAVQCKHSKIQVEVIDRCFDCNVIVNQTINPPQTGIEKLERDG